MLRDTYSQSERLKMSNSYRATDAKLVAERLNLDEKTVSEVICLLDDDNTVPFIARYRKAQTRGLDPNVLRQIKALHNQFREVKVKIENTKKKIGIELTAGITVLLDNAQTSEEIDEIYAPFKKNSKKTLAARAKELGLGPLADIVLNNTIDTVDFGKYVNPTQEGAKTIKQVTLGVQHILADAISKSPASHDQLKKLIERWPPELESTLSSKVAKDDKLSKESMKYKKYHNFRRNMKILKPHEILAINRAERLKILTVKVTLNGNVKNQFLAFAQAKWQSYHGKHHRLWVDTINDAYDRLLSPAICRRTRSSLKKSAEIESKKIFIQNLQSLLLSTPVKGKVLSMDPGYTNGCKMALLSPEGSVLETGLIFPTGRKANIKQAQSEVISLVQRHSCETIAIGNGVACRETEMFIAKMIKDKTFSPLEVAYCIVSEDGASVYSASKEAMAELPDLDLSMRGAVSIGRRLQDPLLELVKIDPKHLGIGMYQHDIPECILRTALQGVVSDCVSLVGVDINAAGISTLKYIAGLNEKKAASILEWRAKNKRFENRAQLTEVKGIGKKTYEQCIGFLKVLPHDNVLAKKSKSNVEVIEIDDDDDDDDDFNTSSRPKRKLPQNRRGSKRSKFANSSVYNYLDATLIHPESYGLAETLMKNLSVRGQDIGSVAMTTAISRLLVKKHVNELASEYSVDVSTVELVLDGLRRPLDYDIRSNFEKPIFKKGVILFEDLRTGMVLSGRVTNVTTFGAFVDCGVGRDGLIHESQVKFRDDPLSAGDVVEATVSSVDSSKKQFHLKLFCVRPRLKAHLLTSI